MSLCPGSQSPRMKLAIKISPAAARRDRTVGEYLGPVLQRPSRRRELPKNYTVSDGELVLFLLQCKDNGCLMKRRVLEQHLYDHGCQLLRHGARHGVWLGPSERERAPVPRHAEPRSSLGRPVTSGVH